MVDADESDVIVKDGVKPDPTWGCEPFRPSIGRAGAALEAMYLAVEQPKCVIAALTATLAPSQLPILLGAVMLDPASTVVACPLTRSELRLSVVADDSSKSRAKQLAERIVNQASLCVSTGEPGKLIVYFNSIYDLDMTRKFFDLRAPPIDAADEAGASTCQLLGPRVRVFTCHAQLLPAGRRSLAEALFRKDCPAGEFEIVFATDAIGRGQDASDVAAVMHGWYPIDMSTYYQRDGRSGRRPGRGGNCTVVGHVGSIHGAYRWARTRSSGVADFLGVLRYVLNVRTCRHRQLQPHIGDQHPLSIGSAGLCCDNCDREVGDVLSLDVTGALCALAVCCSELSTPGAPPPAHGPAQPRPPLPLFTEVVSAYQARWPWTAGVGRNKRWIYQLALFAVSEGVIELAGAERYAESEDVRVSVRGSSWLGQLAREASVPTGKRLVMDVVAEEWPEICVRTKDAPLPPGVSFR
mmetsp:Transcript_14401/g.36500  ORF Transcript_14401/g.36500 Transcript_14401/m.36500 type:complete len:467 (+) Transcript_14401:1009-2409(+)